MKKNMGFIDRLIRVLITIGVVTCYFTHLIDGLTAIILLVLAGIFFLTSLVSFCPLYLPFGISTIKKEIKNLTDATK